MCQQCYNERLTAQGLAPLKCLAVEGSREQEGASWQTMENAWQRPVYIRNVGSFSLARAKARDAEKEKQEGIQGQWQQECPAKKKSGTGKNSADTDCTPK